VIHRLRISVALIALAATLAAFLRLLETVIGTRAAAVTGVILIVAVFVSVYAYLAVRSDLPALSLPMPFDDAMDKPIRATRIPVEIGPYLLPDPLCFAVVFTRAVGPSDVETVWDVALDLIADEMSEAEASHDHVSGFLPAEAATLDGESAVVWTVDAAVARPTRIRRLIVRTANQLARTGLPIARVVVGDCSFIRES
jgi:hypothetical protein